MNDDGRNDRIQRRNDPLPRSQLWWPDRDQRCREPNAEDVQAGRVEPDQVDESLFASYLNTAGMNDPDLLIRTAGEMRISNFLLWQISYSESGLPRPSGPTFARTTCSKPVGAFAGRERKFGGLPEVAAGNSARWSGSSCTARTTPALRSLANPDQETDCVERQSTNPVPYLALVIQALRLDNALLVLYNARASRIRL